MATQQILLDTDIGTDVDDCLALALILASPEVTLTAVTTVYGDARLRGRMVLKLLALRGVSDVPVVAGAERPLLGRPPVYWAGHEGQGLLTPEDESAGAMHGGASHQPSEEHAVDLIVRTVMAHPGEITLIAIGPLTNVALALLKEPRLATNLAGLTVMGGVVGGAGALHLPWVEHNFRCDPEAAQIVLASGAPTPHRTLGRHHASAHSPRRHGAHPGRERPLPPGGRRSDRPVPQISAARVDAPARSAGRRCNHRSITGGVGAGPCSHRDRRDSHCRRTAGETAGRGANHGGAGLRTGRAERGRVPR